VEAVAGILSLHYLVAGDNPSAWCSATVAGRRAAGVYAYVEAARFYSRAIEAGRQVPDLSKPELATVQQALGDAWFRAGEFKKSSEAYAAARPLVQGHPLAESGVMIKLSRLESKLGNYRKGLRWIERARGVLREVGGLDAARELARASAWQAALLQHEGRTVEALECAERTVAAAQQADDPEALGEAYLVMGWACTQLGREGVREHMQRALEAYERSGNLIRQASVTQNLGVVFQSLELWDESVAHFERGGEAFLKIGSTVNAAISRLNIAEILTDRGEWADAEALLLETLPVWKAADYRYFLAYCLTLLGRVSLSLGRCDEALGRLEEAKALFLRVGANDEVPTTDARIAECRMAMGNPEAALKIVRGELAHARESNAVAKLVPLLERIRGHSLLRKDDLRGARDALKASLAAARERGNRFEAALTILSLIGLDRLEGREPPPEMVEESQSILSRFKVRAVPTVPLLPR
jgi:tetratricopeptide (TPR) repeat protein